MVDRARKHYLHKWGCWIKNDEYQHPILSPVYKKSLKLINSNLQLEQALEPWFKGGDDIIVEVDGGTFNQQDFQTIQQLSAIIQDSGEVGSFELGNLKITINSLNTYEQDLIKVCNP